MRRLNNPATLAIQYKPDRSPVTGADREVHDMLAEGLANLHGQCPVLSEEGRDSDMKTALQATNRWVVDPVDGTKWAIQFATGNTTCTNFAVHIGLLQDGKPVFGVVHYPAKSETFYTNEDGSQAFWQDQDKQPQKVRTIGNSDLNRLRAAVSLAPDRQPLKIAGRSYEKITMPGGGRVCQVAAGNVDLVHFAIQAKQWDFAGPDAILRAAGGRMIDLRDGTTLSYDSPDFLMAGPSLGASLKLLEGLGFENRD